MVTGRALHFVFKIPDRGLTAKFYREILGMKVTIIVFFIARLDLLIIELYVSAGFETRGILGRMRGCVQRVSNRS